MRMLSGGIRVMAELFDEFTDLPNEMFWSVHEEAFLFEFPEA
jgi:hypothetical protein